MATAPPPKTRPRQARREPTPPSPRWRRWLLLGLIFGLGYGITQRLLEVPWGEGTPKAPTFKEKSPPSGTTLDEMRERQGEKPKPLPADLEELGRQQREEENKEQEAEQEEEREGNRESPVQKKRKEVEPSIERNPSPTSPAQPPTLVPPPPVPPPLLPPPPLPPQQSTPPASQGPIEPPPPLP